MTATAKPAHKTAKKKAANPVPKKSSRSKSLALPGFDYKALDAGDAKQLRGYAQTIADKAGEFRRSVRDMAQAMLAARQVIETRRKMLLEDGKKEEAAAYNFKRWIETEAPSARSSAYRLIQAAERLHEASPIWDRSEVTAVYLLTTNDVPQGAVKEAETAAQKGILTAEKTRDIIAKHRERQAQKDAAEREKQRQAKERAAAKAAASEPVTVEGTVVGRSEEPAAAEERAESPPVVQIYEGDVGACALGGDHAWTPDGEGGQVCDKCGEALDRRTHGARISKEDRKTLQGQVGKLVRIVNNLKLFSRLEAELNALTQAIDRL